MLDFDVRSQGLTKVLNTSKPSDLEWDLKAYRNEKSISYENSYAEMYYEHKMEKLITLV
jgi:YidC/Oxa1 family membrane protein insertase